MKNRIIKIVIALVITALIGAGLIAVLTRTNAQDEDSTGGINNPKIRSVITNEVKRFDSSSNNLKIAESTSVVAEAKSTITNAVATTNLFEQSDAAIALRMEELLDEGHHRDALYVARRIMGSESVDVRSDVVSTLGWIGVAALPELTMMLNDSDNEIAEEVFTQWEMAVDNINNEQLKADLLVASSYKFNDETDLDAVMIKFGDLDEDIALDSLVPLVACPNRNLAEAAKEQIEFITGEDYTTPEALKVYRSESKEDK